MNFRVAEARPAESSGSLDPVSAKSFKSYRTRTTIGKKAFALVVLVSFSPVLLIVGLLILLGGQNPIFVQDRVGFQGELFRIFKFRTMPDRGWHVARRHAQGNALLRFRLAIFERVSVVLRATGLDEVPLFANILKGDMQVIGPRPLIVEDFIALPEGRMGRCVVPPGITGFAQVNGGQDLDAASKLALDLYLIEHMSVSLVIKIVMRTILRILGVTSATSNICAIDLKLAQAHVAGQNDASEMSANKVPWLPQGLDRLPARAKVLGEGKRYIKDVSLEAVKHH